MTSGNEKGRRFFGWSKPTKRHPKICDLFFTRLMFFSRKAPIQKRRRRRKVVTIRICPSSNHVSCSESAIKIYGSKEEIRIQKSPETVDAPGFTPDASIPVTLYGAAGQIRTADLILTKKPSCFLVSTYSCHGIPPNPLRYKGFGVFHCSSHVICFFLILGHFSLFVGRFVGTLLASPTIFFIFYTLLDSSQCPLARQEMLAKGCKYRFFRSNCTATVSAF